MGTVTLHGHIIVADDELETIKAALEDHISLTLEEAGCLSFEVTQRDDAPSTFDVREAFVDQAAFDLHQARVHDSAWGRASRNVERHYTVTNS